jgi:Dolichyl-phosphate-mannose-protein mannosyltransferase
MFAILPLISFLVFIRFFYLRSNSQDFDFRLSFLYSTALFGILITLITELLSAANLISFFPVLLSWGVITIAAIFLYYRTSSITPGNNNFNYSFNIYDKYLLAGITFIAGVELLICLAAPPNTWDSMTYHMARVAHWIQNKNIDFFPTHVLRQIQHSPWSEFAIMHLQVLSNGDRFANLIQWFCMVGSIIGVSLIAKILGADKRGQIFTSAVVSTIPMGILQASSTQTDYVVSFWLVCSVFFILAMRQRPNWFYLIAASISYGLAILTKGVAYIYGFPFLLWWGISQTIKSRSAFLRYVLVFITLVVFINASHYLRNYFLCENPLGVTEGIVIDEISTKTFYSNTIRNIGLHIGTPFPALNYFLEKGVYRIVGSDINDPMATWKGKEFHVYPTSFYEDDAGNFIHILLLISSFIILCLLFHKIKKPILLLYSAALITAFLLFSLLLKWQPWNSRLHLPLFILGAPVIGTVFSMVMKPKNIYALAVFLILASFPWLFCNTTRPIIKKNNIFNTKRIEQYFVNMPAIKIPYKKIAAEISSKKYTNIGLQTKREVFEYPLWVLLKNDNCRFEHVNVKNISKTIRTDDFRPDVIISNNNELIKLIKCD